MRLLLFRLAFFLVVTSGFESCDKEFSEIGTGIVGTPSFEIQVQSYPVITYNKKIKPIQTNNLPQNLLGYYYDPVFGASTVNFVSQMSPTNFNPDFGDATVLDSVILSVPYTSTAQTNSDNEISYELDSVYGRSSIKLSVYQNNFFLRDFEPDGDIDVNQKYYSNGALSEEFSISQNDLEGQLLHEDLEFIPSNEVIEITEINEDTGESQVVERLPPGLRASIYNSSSDEPSTVPEGYWQELIINKEQDEVLSNSNNFLNYFRGLYFKVEPNSATDGSLLQLDFSNTNANITLYYTYETEITSNGATTTTTQQGTYEIRFSGNRVNIFDNNFDASVLQQLSNADSDQGDERLYLKGGEGSMAIIELFAEDINGQTLNDYLSDFREIDSNDRVTVKRLINEAFLEFYVDESLSPVDLPNRVYIYDIKNNIPLSDYFLDQTVNTTSADAKYTHLVPLSAVTAADGTEQKRYKIRLTDHINRIIAEDSTNVKLGLVVSSNVGAATSRTSLNDNLVETIPEGTILSPKSVVLHGNNTASETQKVKLNIYYTDPNN